MWVHGDYFSSSLTALNWKRKLAFKRKMKIQYKLSFHSSHFIPRLVTSSYPNSSWDPPILDTRKVGYENAKVCGTIPPQLKSNSANVHWVLWGYHTRHTEFHTYSLLLRLSHPVNSTWNIPMCIPNNNTSSFLFSFWEPVSRYFLWNTLPTCPVHPGCHETAAFTNKAHSLRTWARQR